MRKMRKLVSFILTACIAFSIVSASAKSTEELKRTNLFVKDQEIKTLFEEYHSYQAEFNWKPAAKRKYVYTSEDPSIATVNEKGVITPISKGKTDIRADYVKNGQNYYDILHVNVRTPYVFIKNKVNSLSIGERYVFKTNTGGSDSRSGDFEWTVSDKRIGTITTGNSTATFIPKKVGKVKIKVRDKNTGGTSSCVVRVVSDEVPFGIQNMVEELWWAVDYKLYTQGTKNNVKWEVSDPSIAAITTDGVLTGLKEGKVTVRVTDEKTKETKSYPLVIKWIPETPIEKFRYIEEEEQVVIFDLVDPLDSSLEAIRIPEKVNGKGVILDVEEGTSIPSSIYTKTLILPNIKVTMPVSLSGEQVESIVILNRDTEVKLHLFGDRTPNLKEYIVPYDYEMEMVDELGEGIVANCKSMKQMILPKTVTWELETAYGNIEEIGEKYLGSPFKNCENMEIVLPSTLKELRTLCENCKNMRIVIPSSVTKISEETFRNCKKNEITILTQKGSYAEKYAKENDYPYEYIH